MTRKVSQSCICFTTLHSKSLALVFNWGSSAVGDHSAMAAVVFVVVEEPKSESRIYLR